MYWHVYRWDGMALDFGYECMGPQGGGMAGYMACAAVKLLMGGGERGTGDTSLQDQILEGWFVPVCVYIDFG